jgi:glycosyltransferase involved in cell wall biosynthesis
MTSHNVIIVCGAGYVSGKEIMALELGHGLLAAGCNVRYVTSSWHNGDFASRLLAAGIPFVALPIGFISATLTVNCMRMTGEQILRWPALVWGYSRVLSEITNSTVIHTNWHHLLLLLPFLSRRRDWFWLHEFIPDKPHYRQVFTLLARRLNGIVCVSNAVAESLRKIGIPQSKIHVVHNGVSFRESRSKNEDDCSLPTCIGIVGQVGEWKGHGDLVDALKSLVNLRRNVCVKIFGAGSEGYSRELKLKIQALGLSEFVEWVGFKKDKGEIFATIDICAVPSRFQEPFGLVAVEAAIAGVPVVATRQGGLPEIVDDEVTGLLVDANNSTQLSAALDRLVLDKALRHQLGQAAKIKAQSQFSADRFMLRIRGLLGV